MGPSTRVSHESRPSVPRLPKKGKGHKNCITLNGKQAAMSPRKAHFTVQGPYEGNIEMNVNALTYNIKFLRT